MPTSWWQVWQVLRELPGWTFEWLPSHRSQAEATAAGVSQDDWLGNEQADEAAKAQAWAMDNSPLLLSEWAEKQVPVEDVWRLTDESQVSPLAGRPRRVDGSAVKARKRKGPARPGLATRSGASRRPQQPMRGAQRQATAGGEVQSLEPDGRSCRRRRVRCSGNGAAAVVGSWP